MNQVINLKEKTAKLDELWSPRIIGELDDAYYAKIAKLKGEFAWHSHDDEDELFIVIKGKLKIQMEDRTARYFYLDRLMPMVIGIDKKLAIQPSLSRDTLG